MTTVARIVRCPPDAVLDVLADGWSYASWVVGTSRIRGVDAAWPAPGTQIAHSAGLWPFVIDDVTVVREWDRDAGVIDLQARGWPAGEARVRIEVRPRGDGCVVRLVEDAVRGPATALPGPLRAAALQPRNRETVRRLAMMAEGRSATHPGPPDD